MKPGPNAGYSGRGYIIDKEYAIEPMHYTRAFLIIQKDLEQLFEYVEPGKEGIKTYSYRIHQLLMRTCIEVEANFKAILNENIFTPAVDRFGNPILNMTIYKKVDVTHHLSSYAVILPIWNGPDRIIKPFRSWRTKAGGSPEWYKAYNASKHDRHESFKKANLQNLLDAVAGLLVLISSQFGTQDFSAGQSGLALEGYDYHRLSPAIGSLFRIKFPNDWKRNEIYDFDWSVLQKQPNRFEKIDYNKI
jgi:hypothetical protein